MYIGFQLSVAGKLTITTSVRRPLVSGMNSSSPDSVEGIPTTPCDSDASRIRHWVETGVHIANDSNTHKKRDDGSFSVPSYGKEDDATDGGDSTSSSIESIDQLVGCENDLLIPTVSEIRRTFFTAQHT